jgi:MFS family permease
MAIIGVAVGEAASGSYKTLLAARILQGFSTSAFESLLIAAVGDMFFVHQRGIRVAFITFVLNAASSLASIICGQVTAGLGWVWLFHLLQIFTVVQFVLMFLFCPESTYIRDHAYDIDQVQDEKLEQLVETEQRRQHHGKDVTEGATLESTASTVPPPPKKSFRQELAVYTGKYEDANIIKLLIGPFITLLNIGTCWEAVCSGILTMWYVTSGISQAAIFSAPPWNFDAAQVGYLSTGPFVGGLVGSAIIAFTSDPIAKFLTKINKGI